MELNRKAKGDIAELKVAADLRSRGYKLAFPYGEDVDFDLILCRDNGALGRVQVKYARSDRRVINVQCHSKSLTNGRVKATKLYTAQTIDWLAVWDATVDRCFYIPASELGAGVARLHLRLAAPLNGQMRWIRLAEQYTVI